MRLRNERAVRPNLERLEDRTVPAGPFVEWPVAAGGNGHRYALTDAAVSWDQAEAEAVALGGHLASVTSRAENDFILNNLNGGWIGFNDIASEGKFAWTTGEPVTFTNWAAGEP